MLKVILLIDCASQFDRKLLRGIVRYSAGHGPWQFYRMPSYYRWDEDGEKHILEWARKWKADAIVGRWNSPEAPLLKTLGIPIVLQNYDSRSTAYSVLTGDYIGTGRMAGDYFRRRQFKDFAYFGLKGVVWSEERLQGLRESVEEGGGTLSVHQIEVPENDARKEVTAWLHSLPKPVALFCCDDARALFISEICKIEGIRIPEDLALLGVDNDDLFCEISDPPISSIDLDVENGGYAVCAELEKHIAQGDKGTFSVVISPRGIVERRSTDRHDISDPLIAKVVRYIDEHFREDIGTDEIMEQAPLSRRSLEMRFRRAMQTTPYQYLVRCRIEHLAMLLRSTDLPVGGLAISAGFRDTANICRTFKKYKGCTPQEYRLNSCDI